MSLQVALDFVVAVRERPELAARVKALGPSATMDDLVGLGAEAGFAFGSDHLRAAHKADWAMRWVRYGHNDSSG